MLFPNTGGRFGITGDSKYLAVGSQGGQVFIFDLLKNKLEEIFSDGHTSPVVGCAWDPSNSSRLVSIDSMGHMLVWE